jgi:protocatechuate 4,5-dioxygenase beta chain
MYAYVVAARTVAFIRRLTLAARPTRDARNHGNSIAGTHFGHIRADALDDACWVGPKNMRQADSLLVRPAANRKIQNPIDRYSADSNQYLVFGDYRQGQGLESQHFRTAEATEDDCVQDSPTTATNNSDFLRSIVEAPPSYSLLRTRALRPRPGNEITDPSPTGGSMAEIAIVIGVSHLPRHHRDASVPRELWSEDTIRRVQLAETLRAKLRSANPDALVVVANDHFHQFFMNLMPAFCIAKMERFDGIFHNEVREFGLPRRQIPGDAELADDLLQGMLARDVDIAYSNELKVDHGVVVPLTFVRPEMDLPIVPLFGNVIAPPLPPAKRFYRVGEVLRETIDTLPRARRIGVVVTGNLSLDVGGPRQFDGTQADPVFDDLALEWIRRGQVDDAIRHCTFERLTNAGNTTYGFLLFLLAMGIVRGAPATYVEVVRRGGLHPFIAWEDLA